MEDSSLQEQQQKDDSEIIDSPSEEAWKRMIENHEDEIPKVDIYTFKKRWMYHPNKEALINWRNESIQNGATLLICAIWTKRSDIAKLLVEHGADITIADNDGDNPLLNASDKGLTDVVQLLLEKGAEINTANKDGETALMCASQGGHHDTVKLLLEKGANITVADKNGGTSLMWATNNGHTDIVKVLLEKGADITVAHKNGWNSLMLASKRGHTKSVEVLVDNGADLSIADNEGRTALTLAAIGGHTNTVDLLVAKGADSKMCTNNGQTLLHLSCLHNMKASVQQVLELGIEKNELDNDIHTALYYAAEKGFADIVDLLVKHNADVDRADERRLVEKTDPWGDSYSFYVVKDGRTPLFIAAKNGHHHVVAALLRHGANPYLCNHLSQIPSEVAVHEPVKQLFRIHDYFSQRKQGDAFATTYITCKTSYWKSSRVKKPVPPLEDIIHDIVKYPQFADKFLELYQENRDIVNLLDKEKRTVRQVACKECRDVTLFMGQYELDDEPIYESPTCKIYNALDHGGHQEPILTEPRQVAMKFMEEEEHFNNEIRSRQNDDGSRRFSSEFVTPDLAAYRADNNKEYAKACKTWKANGAMLSAFCLVMPRGERSLLEAMNAENLSSKSKDLQRREILLTLCKIFSYLHEVGYVHGDVKPHNVVRHTGDNVTWKAIDFDACTKIGEAVGLKLTTGSAPPEMLKATKGEASDKESTGDSSVILRQPGADGLNESDLVLADPSFDVWQFGILMYQLLTGRSFFHSDLQGNLDAAGLQELANLTQGEIHEKLRSVKEVNARVLLYSILRLDPKERPTMSDIGEDYYFHPSEAPQGRKAKFFHKEGFDGTSAEINLSSTNETRREEMDEDSGDNVNDVKRFASSKSAFSYFELRDRDKDWSDKLLNSEVETFRFDKLEGMGEKPRLVDGDVIYGNNFLRGLLSSKGPDYFMGFLVEYFELYKIMDDAHEVCQGIKANLVSDVKSLRGIFTKLFVRGKGLNDVVRATLFCNSIDQFKYVGRQLKERYGYNVYIKPPKDEAGAWPIPKLLICGDRRVCGRCMSVEIQFSTVYMHLATHASNNHLVYEAMRESTGYLSDKDKDFQEFLQSLNEQYIDTEGFLRSQSVQEGRFEILVEQAADEILSKGGGEIQCIPKATGFITNGRICCGNQFLFRFMSPKDHFQRFSESSFVVNKNLTLLSSHSYWSEESYDLEGKSVEFVVSFKGRGLAIAGIGTAECFHGTTESNGGGDRCSVHVARSKFVVRKNGVQEAFREKKLPNQERATIRFTMKDGMLSVSFAESEREDDEEEIESVPVNMPSNQEYYLYMRAPPGVHDIKFHDVNIK